MDPLTLMAIASMIGAGTSVAGMMKKTPGQNMFPEAMALGSKPMIQPSNPYQSPMAATGQDPYGRMMNPMMRRPPMLSSTLGRYGGLG